eukprot:COSAG01_NODE_9982_length_2283_cov_177.290293_3_plen_63_part_00
MYLPCIHARARAPAAAAAAGGPPPPLVVESYTRLETQPMHGWFSGQDPARRLVLSQAAELAQ